MEHFDYIKLCQGLCCSIYPTLMCSFKITFETAAYWCLGSMQGCVLHVSAIAFQTVKHKNGHYANGNVTHPARIPSSLPDFDRRFDGLNLIRKTEKLRVSLTTFGFVRKKRLKRNQWFLPRFWKKGNESGLEPVETQKNQRRGSSCCCSTSLLYLDFGQKLYLSTAKHQWNPESRLPSDLFMVFLVGMILELYICGLFVAGIDFLQVFTVLRRYCMILGSLGKKGRDGPQKRKSF